METQANNEMNIQCNWAVVIPSIRQINLDLLRFIPDDVHVYVVDDSDGSIVPNRVNMTVFYYDDQRRILGPNVHLVPRKTAACRNFAYYYIWKETDYTHIVTLDDDCSVPANFLSAHGVIGVTREHVTCTSPTGWINSTDLLPVGGRAFARGYPYWLREEPVEHVSLSTTARSVCNLGLWSHHLDFDAMDKYVASRYQQVFDFDEAKVNNFRIGTPECPTLIPFSGMNVAFIREALPVATQVPMNQQIGMDYALHRFDDLWCGILLQAVVNKRVGDCLTAGSPVVKHLRAGNLQAEMRGEHYGHLLSPHFQDIVQEAIEEVHFNSYAAMYADLCEVSHEIIVKRGERLVIPRLYARVLSDIFECLSKWARLFL